MRGVSQYDQYGHDLSAAYGAELEPDGDFTVSAYVYPARTGLAEGFDEVVDVMRRRWPELGIPSQLVTVDGHPGWCAEAVITDEKADATGAHSTAVWLFQEDGWFIKYRVSASGEGAWTAATRRALTDFMAAIGWPGAAARLEAGRKAAVVASGAALATALEHAAQAPDDTLAEVLAALDSGDHAAAQAMVEGMPRPLPAGWQSVVVAAALVGDVTNAYFLADVMRGEDQESRDVERLLRDWYDDRIRFDGGVGASPDTAVVVDAPEPGIRAHAIHHYLTWLLGPPGHMWWIRGVGALRTESGPREVIDVALRDGRHLGIWFDTDIDTDALGDETAAPAGILRWPGPRSIDAHLQLHPSVEAPAGELQPVAMRLAEHAVQAEISARRPDPGATPAAAAFAGLCALDTDYALERTRYERLPPPPDDAELEAVNFYIHYKAFLLCEKGPGAYAADDYFGVPKPEWGEARLETVMSGARQLVDWRGISPDAPLRGLEIRGFRDLLDTLHFTLASQALVAMDDDWAVDAMTMRHVMDEREVTLYNVVTTSRARPLRN